MRSGLKMDKFSYPKVKREDIKEVIHGIEVSIILILTMSPFLRLLTFIILKTTKTQMYNVLVLNAFKTNQKIKRHFIRH